VRRELGVGEGTVGKREGFVDSTENPQRDGVINFRLGAGILAEPVGEIGIAGRVVKLDGLLKALVGAGKISEIKAEEAGYAVGVLSG
jgi:hypothetical protein